jgi:hypothetical protein
MAFTSAQKNKICMILGIKLPILEYQMQIETTYITAQTETDVIAQLTRWDAGAGSSFVKVHPRERNYGVETNSEKEKDDILLTDYVKEKGALTGGAQRITRG